MKKAIAIILSLLVLISASVVCVGAQAKDEKISIEFRSDISGLDYKDKDKLAIIHSDNIAFNSIDRFSPLQINDYVGDVYLDKLKPGRTYTFSYSFEAKDGYTIPENPGEDDVEFICGKGCKVWWYHRSQGTDDNGCTCYFFDVYTEVTVDGNFFQLLFGRLTDSIRKLLSWSPY